MSRRGACSSPRSPPPDATPTRCGRSNGPPEPWPRPGSSRRRRCARPSGSRSTTRRHPPRGGRAGARRCRRSSDARANSRRSQRLVDEYPLVTLVGPGGVGKTRLAREVAERSAPRHALGSRVIELARLDPADSLVDAVLDGLGVLRGERSALEAVERLGDLDLLVVLDNCEHVLEGVCELVERMLRRGGRMRVLATSRQRLGLPGEQVSRLEPLDVAPDGAAQQLFTDRARSVTAVADRLPTAVVQAIVERLDGLPLAIEMAAARLDTMTCDELAEMLQTKLTTLQATRHGGDPRHRTLVSAVEWSEDLLDDEERWAFAAFSVFAGPVEGRDVAGVLGSDCVELVRRLAGRSLIVADVSGDRARYHQLETVKAHAAARLSATGRSAEVAERHARHVLAAAQAADASARHRRRSRRRPALQRALRRAASRAPVGPRPRSRSRRGALLGVALVGVHPCPGRVLRLGRDGAVGTGVARAPVRHRRSALRLRRERPTSVGCTRPARRLTTSSRRHRGPCTSSTR